MSITSTATFTRLDGGPASGTVRITPSRSPILDSAGQVVISGPQTFPLGPDGTLSTPIPASNDPELGPPFTYTVEALLSHNHWKISKVWIPHGPSTIDISTIADYTPVPGEPTRTVKVPTGGVDGQVLVWDGAGFSWDYPPQGEAGLDGDIFPVHRDTWSGTVTLDTLSRTHIVTLTGDTTITLDPQSPDWSGTITLDLTQDATGGWTLALPGVASAWAVGIVPHPAALSRTIVHLMWTGATWVGMVAATNVGIPSGGGV